MKKHTAPQKPIDYAEQALVTAILDQTYPPNSTLPGERQLATLLGVTRPTLREVLRRLERDGWLTIQQGKATRVNNFWQEGGLNLLSTLVQYSQHIPANFVNNLLEVRATIAPAYTQAAITHNASQVADYLTDHTTLLDTATAFAHFDWELHHHLTILSNNPIYTLILNGFGDFYQQMALPYFTNPLARELSRTFYAQLYQVAHSQHTNGVHHLTQNVMKQSLVLWQKLSSEQ